MRLRAVLVLLLAASASAAPERWDHLRTALYCTSRDVDQLLGTPDARRATLAYFAPLRLSKFYLENARPEPSAIPGLRTIAEDLQRQGYEVAGAVVPNEGGPLAYNEPHDRELLAARVRVLAQVFDEIIVDDWLFTNSTSPRSVSDRGRESWADYRSRLVAEQAKIHLIDAARSVNPRCRVIIKYPNWYEGHRRNGYDVSRQSAQFDGVSVGIETRQPTRQDQHIPTYSGYVFQRWIGGAAGPKWRSAWLDNYRMEGDDADYLAEVGQAVLARTPEIIFWAAGQLHPPTPSASNYAALVEKMPEFDRLAGLLRGPARGVPFHLPLGAVGEYNLFGYLGMIGIPIDPVTDFPVDAPAAIFSLHSLAAGEPRVADALESRLRAGREEFVTWPLFQRVRAQRAEIAQALEVIRDDGWVESDRFRLDDGSWRQSVVDAGRSFLFPKIELTTWPYARRVSLIREDADFAVLMRTEYLGGHLDVLNLPDNRYDLVRLPPAVLDSVRACFAPMLGVRLEAPGGVALYLFGPDQFVVYNLTPSPVRAALHPHGAGASSTGWHERLHNLVITQGADGAPSLSLAPYELAVIERR